MKRRSFVSSLAVGPLILADRVQAEAGPLRVA
jgi:hypothetical protein